MSSLLAPPLAAADVLLAQMHTTAIAPALALLPGGMTSPRALVMLHAIALQESRYIYRRQLGNGPARGFWQFERGTRESKGGVWGVCLHPASAPHLRRLCVAREVPFDAAEIWRAIEFDDVLAAGLARLLLWTDAQALPDLGDAHGAWKLYAHRCWRPGKPHPDTWPAFYARALAAVQGGKGRGTP